MKKITSIIAHIDHGKTTLIDSLIAAEGHISNYLAGDLKCLDSRKDEQKRGITLKLSPIHLSNNHIIIDTPGHVDLEHLIFCSSIYSDNFIILIDVNEGITPRTYSLIKYIDKKRSILALNKIDKCENNDVIEAILHEMNHLIGEEVFKWELNNVILCTSIFCAGICYATNTFSKKNTLKTAHKAYKTLISHFEKGNIENVIKKYKIIHPTKKNVLRSVFPLHSVVFKCINTLYSNDLADKLSDITLNNKKIKNDFFNIKFDKPPQVYAISVYGIINDNIKAVDCKILHLVRIFTGRLSKGDSLFSFSKYGKKEVTINRIFRREFNKFKEIEYAEGCDLVCIEANIDKNSIITDSIAEFNLKNLFSPFYKSILILDDLEDVDDLKIVFKRLSYVEQCLRVTMNRFCEFEIGCAGKVQFEKILQDLKDANFQFKIKPTKLNFREYATTCAKYDADSLNIIIKPLEGGDLTDNELRNKINVVSERDEELIESILDVFIDSGPLINENIAFTSFDVIAGYIEGDNVYNTIKGALENTFLKTKPSISPLSYYIKMSVDEQYLGVSYNSLQKYFYQIIDENYNEKLSFYEIEFYIPQFALHEFIEDIRLKTKGTVYISVLSSKYIKGEGFDDYIIKIKKQKGIYTEDVIVENPEKQRTLKK